MSNLLQLHRERIGRRVRQARTDSGHTLDGLAAKVGSSRQHLIKLEKGQHAPRAEMLQRIADATGKPPAFFADEDEEESALTMSAENALAEIAKANTLLADLMQQLVDAKLEKSERSVA